MPCVWPSGQAGTVCILQADASQGIVLYLIEVNFQKKPAHRKLLHPSSMKSKQSISNPFAAKQQKHLLND